MRPLHLIPVLSALVLLSGCASIIDGPSQPLRIDTPGASESECHLTNGIKYRVKGGDTIKIQRSHRDLVIDCYGSGNRNQKVTIPSAINEWGYANVTNAVIPGATYDHLSGALYAYPTVVTVDFTGTPTRGFDTPGYQNFDAPNPYEQKIENYTSTVPALTTDGQAATKGLQKRERNLNSNPFVSSTPSPTSATISAPSAKTAPSSAVSSGAAPVVSTTPTATPTGSNAEQLTRSANPSVFGNQ